MRAGRRGEAVGEGVSEFEVGDHVFGRSGFGANAEFICMRESAPLAHKPAGMTFDEAAAVCDGAILALPYGMGPCPTWQRFAPAALRP